MKDILAISLAKKQVTATTSLPEADLLKYFISPGTRGVMATQTVLNATGVATDTGTITTKLQYSTTTVDTDFVDLTDTDAVFTVVADTDIPTTAGAMEQIFFALPSDRYIRAYATVTGTPIFDVSINLFVVKREA
jgi:hypothetical protein